MRIALITSMSYGLFLFVFRDIDALMRKGNDVSIFTLRNKRGLYNPQPDWKVYPISLLRLIWSPFWKFFRSPRRVLKLLWTALETGSIVDLIIALGFVNQMREADVIYSYFGDHKLFVGYYCKHLLDIPLVVTIRAYELYNNPNPKMFREAISHCDRILTVSEFNKDQLIEQLHVPSRKIEVVRQIIDLERFKHQPKIKILIVGFFTEKKGHKVLFQAIKRMGREDVELWVVGDKTQAPDLVDCVRLAQEFDVEEQVVFFGEQRGNALKALYQECDIFCLPSLTAPDGNKEGFPNVIAEAMAFGKPVVTTRHAGIPEVVREILVDENNVVQLAGALAMLCNDSKLRQELGQKNRAIVEKLFSMANNDRLEEILRHLAGESRISNMTWESSRSEDQTEGWVP